MKACAVRVFVSMVTLMAFFTPFLPAQAAHPDAREPLLRSKMYVYSLLDGTSHLIFTSDSIWEAPNWSPDGKYLIANHDGAIYRLVLQPDGKAEPQKLAIPVNLICNNDKSVSPDGTKLAFSATPAHGQGSEVFVADANGENVQQITFEAPSYFHGWSPDNKTLAFVAQRGGSGQFDIYGIPVGGGKEVRFTSNPHHDDGPDYSPVGKWIYINSDRSGKEAVWRFPVDGAGPGDVKAKMVVSDGLEDWFPHISPDGTKMVYIGYPAGTPTHNPRNVKIVFKLVSIEKDKVSSQKKTLVEAVGGQGSMNVNSWSPDSTHFAYVTYEPLP